MKLSKNFTLQEMTKSDTAIRKNISNLPGPEHLQALTHLCTSVLQPIRDKFGPLRVTSGYRSPALNRAIDGSSNSQHSKGEAADIECVDETSNLDLAKWIADTLPFDQLILEFWDGKDPKSGWVHVSAKARGNRGQVLRAYKNSKGKTVYAPVNLKEL